MGGHLIQLAFEPSSDVMGVTYMTPDGEQTGRYLSLDPATLQINCISPTYLGLKQTVDQLLSWVMKTEPNCPIRVELTDAKDGFFHTAIFTREPVGRFAKDQVLPQENPGGEWLLSPN